MSHAGLLLDLDGTLVDTAPDMIASLNRLLAEERHAEVRFPLARAHVSDGAAGLIGVGFGIARDHADMPRLRQRFLQIYAARVHEESSVFNGFREVLALAGELGWRWGVVTNKPEALAVPLMQALALYPDHGCLVGGDTLARRKPHPDPLLHAARCLALDPARCIYVGDAPRDIEAGRAAGMLTVAARYGYLRVPSDAGTWGADFIIDRPAELAPLLHRLDMDAASDDGSPATVGGTDAAPAAFDRPR